MFTYPVLGSGLGKGMSLSARDAGYFPLDNVSQTHYIYHVSQPTSFRLSDTALNLVIKLAEALGLKRSAVIELAIRELAKRHKIDK